MIQFWSYLAEFFLEWEIFRANVVEKIKTHFISSKFLNPSNAELNPICHLLALLGAHPILYVSRIRVNTCWMPKAKNTYSE
jgi:hypothetical protein